MGESRRLEEGDPYTNPACYESLRYEGVFGRYRRWREGHLLGKFLDRTESGDLMLDCPAGVGRLFPAFLQRGLQVVGADLSREMLNFAKRNSGFEAIEMLRTRAEELAVKDNGVDWVFSFALMKHLSPDVQMSTLAEFSRVARRGIVVSFAILNPLSFPRWWFQYRGKVEPSFPIPEQWLRLAAERLHLNVNRLGAVVPGLGLETLYLLSPADSAES